MKLKRIVGLVIVCGLGLSAGVLVLSAHAECCTGTGSWDAPGFAKRYQRDYNPFAGGSEPDNPVTWPNDIHSAFNPINKYDPNNPANPMNRAYDLTDPLNPANRYDPRNPLTSPNAIDVPFAPLR
jgi:hypothetical protein